MLITWGVSEVATCILKISPLYNWHFFPPVKYKPTKWSIYVITNKLYVIIRASLPPLSLWVWAIFLNLLLVNPWQQEMTFGPGDRLLYFPNHIHRVPNLEWKLKRGGFFLWSLDTGRNHLPLSPRDPSGAKQRRDSNNNSGRGRGWMLPEITCC